MAHLDEFYVSPMRLMTILLKFFPAMAMKAGMLEKFWEIVDSISMLSVSGQWKDYGVQFIGHNVMDFDLRFIYQRSIINKIKPAYDLPFVRYRSYPIYDTMKEWTKWSNSSIGLEHIVLALGIPTPKDGIDGSQVYEFYKKVKSMIFARIARGMWKLPAPSLKE